MINVDDIDLNDLQIVTNFSSYFDAKRPRFSADASQCKVLNKCLYPAESNVTLKIFYSDPMPFVKTSIRLLTTFIKLNSCSFSSCNCGCDYKYGTFNLDASQI